VTRILPDVNVLVNAYVPSAQFHNEARIRLERATTARATSLCLYWPILVGTVRILQSPKIWSEPMPASGVVQFVEALVLQSEILAPGDAYLGIFSDLVTRFPNSGNLIADVSYAAIAIEHGCTILTFDRDFERFQGLRVELLA
jgi:uncharacterized protein